MTFVDNRIKPRTNIHSSQNNQLCAIFFFLLLCFILPIFDFLCIFSNCLAWSHLFIWKSMNTTKNKSILNFNICIFFSYTLFEYYDWNANSKRKLFSELYFVLFALIWFQFVYFLLVDCNYFSWIKILHGKLDKHFIAHCCNPIVCGFTVMHCDYLIRSIYILIGKYVKLSFMKKKIMSSYQKRWMLCHGMTLQKLFSL